MQFAMHSDMYLFCCKHDVRKGDEALLLEILGWEGVVNLLTQVYQFSYGNQLSLKLHCGTCVCAV